MKKLLLILITLPALYCGAWFYVANEIKTQAHHIYDVEAPKNGYSFLGDKPKVSGFPLKHIITLDRGIEIEGTKIEFETATLKVLPLPNQPIDINIEQLAIYNNDTKQLYEIDNIDATLVPPKNMPATMTKQDLTAWQKNGDVIEVKNLQLTKNSMHLNAKGIIGLDEKLQPTLNLKTKMSDYDKLIHFMTAETSELSPIAGAIALSVLNAMAKEDLQTGGKFVEFNAIIKNRRLTLGPLQAIKLPKVYWPDK